MKQLTYRKLKIITLVLVLVLSKVSCFVKSQNFQLNKTGDCPQAKEYQQILVEGYFSIDPKKGVATEDGFEGNYPCSRFTFSAEPKSESKFEVALVIVNEGNNGSEKANRAEFIKNNNEQYSWHIYDNKRQEINFKDKVQITGTMIRNCVLKVEKLEKL